MVKLKSVRALFIVATLGLTLVASSPALGMLMPFGDGSEPFSEFWLLGPDHTAEGYPFNVTVGEEYTVFVGVTNHMGNSEYYQVNVKLSNSTELVPDIDSGVPSYLPCLYIYPFFVADGDVWESAITFSFEDLTLEDDVLSVGNVTINGLSFPVDTYAVWDAENEGYFFELFFELWRYDGTDDIFRYTDRFIGLWLSLS